MGPEAKIERNNGDFARTLRIIFRKLNFGEGWPDRVLLYGGQVLFIEYKAPGERPTALQNYQIDILRKQGFRVEVIDNIDNGRKLIKDWHDGVDQYLAKVRGGHDQDKRSGPHVLGYRGTESYKVPRLDGEVRDVVPPVLRRGPSGQNR